MRTTDFEGWDTEPYCTRTSAHILADPEHWSLHVEEMLIDGEIYTGSIAAHRLTTQQLITALGSRDA